MPGFLNLERSIPYLLQCVRSSNCIKIIDIVTRFESLSFYNRVENDFKQVALLTIFTNSFFFKNVYL